VPFIGGVIGRRGRSPPRVTICSAGRCCLPIYSSSWRGCTPPTAGCVACSLARENKCVVGGGTHASAPTGRASHSPQRPRARHSPASIVGPAQHTSRAVSSMGRHNVRLASAAARRAPGTWCLIRKRLCASGHAMVLVRDGAWLGALAQEASSSLPPSCSVRVRLRSHDVGRSAGAGGSVRRRSS
jgi:hypothetical protein